MKPIVQALLVADHVYQDGATGKVIIAGVFNRFVVGKPDAPNDDPGQVGGVVEIPVQDVVRAGNPFVYVSLTEVRGLVKVVVRLVALDTNAVCFESSEIPIKSDNPVSTVEFVLPVLPLPVIPGVYAFELLCEGELLGSHRVSVIPQSPPEAAT